MTRSRLGAALLLAATFVLGALLGGTVTTLAEQRAHQKRERPGYLERLSLDLGLSEDQRDSVRAIMIRHQPAMDSIWRLTRPMFQSERQLIRNEISGLLTPEQQSKYAQLQRQDSIRRAESERNRNGKR